MKGVAHCDKLWEARVQALIQRFPNGGTHAGKTCVPLAEHIGQVEETGGTETS